MSRSLHLVLGSDASLVDQSFEDTSSTGLAGRVYADGVFEASTVTVTVFIDDDTQIDLSGLPDVPGVHYAVTYVFGVTTFVVYYPERDEGSYTATRVVPVRTTGETLGSLTATLVEDGVTSAAVLSLTEGVAGSGDYVISGFPVTPASWTLTYDLPFFEFGRRWTISSLTSGEETPETIGRRLLVEYLRQGFLGETFDQKDFCPIAIPGVTFDQEKAADVSPFTSAEVRETVGHAALYIWDARQTDDGTTSGVDANGTMISAELTRVTVQMHFDVPRSSEQPTRLELYSDRFRNLMRGLAIPHAGPPEISLTQRVEDLGVQRSDTDSSNFRRRVVSIDVERRYHRPHAGLQEVIL